MSSIFDTRAARKVVKKVKSLNLNAQRDHYLNKIRLAANTGQTYVMLDDSGWKLFEDDYLFFENLGYSVDREQTKTTTDTGMVYKVFGRISWPINQ